jgi:tetraacyldisaccharide 4'-kinase
MDSVQLRWWQILLEPLSALYSGGLKAYLWWRLARQTQTKAVVISVGNLTLGGTGKTPTVIAICRHLQRKGLRVGVLSRGYGGTMSRSGGVVSDGERIFASVAEAGDEPMLIAHKLPGVPVLVGKDRRQTARVAIKRFGCDFLVLDDGFQYWQMHRDIDLVLLDGECPFGNGWTLPVGILREPIEHLRRAHALLVHGESPLCERLSLRFPSTPCFAWSKSPAGLRQIYQRGSTLSADAVQGQRVFALAAIARFESFVGMLQQLGAHIVGTWCLPDHYRYTPGDVLEVQKRARTCGAEMILLTEKDAVKLEEMPQMTLEVPMFVLDIEARFSEGFWRWLDARARAAHRTKSRQFSATEEAL